VPSPSPAPPQGKNRGFNTAVYAHDTRTGGFGGAGGHGGFGGHQQRDNGFQAERSQGYGGGGGYGGGYGGGSGGYGGGYGGDRRNQGRRNYRRYDDDDDMDDPIDQEFGCDDDYYPEKAVMTSKEDEERLERAYKAESRNPSPREERGTHHLHPREDPEGGLPTLHRCDAYWQTTGPAERPRSSPEVEGLERFQT
jgi:hypothetical protein